MSRWALCLSWLVTLCSWDACIFLRRVAVERFPIARCHHAIILFPIVPEGKTRPFSVVKMASSSSAAKLGLTFLIKTWRLLRTLLVIIRGAGPALLVLWRETYITYFPSISLILSKSRRRAVSSGAGLCPFSRPILAIRKSRTSMKTFLSTGCLAHLKRMVIARRAGVVSLIRLVIHGKWSSIWGTTLQEVN